MIKLSWPQRLLRFELLICYLVTVFSTFKTTALSIPDTGQLNMPRHISLCLLALFTLASTSLHAQDQVGRQPMMASVDPAFFKGLHYRLVGPSRGGRVTTVTGVPSQPKTFYMGVASGYDRQRRSENRTGCCRTLRGAAERL